MVGVDGDRPRLAIAGGLLCVLVMLERPSEHHLWPPSIVVADGLLAYTIVPDLRLFGATVALAVVGSYCIFRRSQLAVPIAAITAAASLAQIGELHWTVVVALLISGAVALVDRSSMWLRLAASAQFVAAGWLAVRACRCDPERRGRVDDRCRHRVDRHCVQHSA
jgi:hypothetical protein